MKKSQQITNVPEYEVESVVSMLHADGAEIIQKIKQPDGNWTIEVSFAFIDPDEPWPRR